MNSSKLSLKEGFDFLFEEKTKKFKITYTKDDVAPRNIEDHIAYILTTDIVTSTINGDDEPLLFRIYNDPKKGKDNTGGFVQGKSISFKLLAKEINKGVEGFKSTFNISSDNVENVGVIAEIYRQYRESINAIQDAGATRMMLEAKMNVLKISKSRYTMLFRTIKNSATFLPKQKGQKTINFTKIFGVVSARINDGELLKTKAAGAGKFEINDNFKDYNDSEKLYLVVYNFFKGLTRDQIAPFGGKTSINKFLQILKNNGDKSTENPKSVEELVKSFRKSWATTKSGTLRKKPVSKKLSKAFDEMVAEALKTESPEEVQSAIDNAQTIVDSIPDEFFDELDKTLSRAGDQEDTPEGVQEESGKDIVNAIMDVFRQTMGGIKPFEDQLLKDKDNMSTQGIVDALANILTPLAKNLGVFQGILETEGEKLSDNEKGQIQSYVGAFEKQIDGYITDFNKYYDELNKPEEQNELSLSFEDMDFDPNSLDIVNYNELDLLNIDLDKLKTGGEEQFNKIKDDIKTEIGSPSPDAADVPDESDTAVEDKAYNQIMIRTPLPECRDYNDFVENYLILSAFAAYLSPGSELEIKAGSAKKMKASQFINLLRSIKNNKSNAGRQLDDQMTGVFKQSISNLEKFANESVNGLIFEREGGAQKFWIKMKASDVAKRIDVYKLSMENTNDALVEAKMYAKACPFELTDSKGQSFASNTDDAINMFMKANTSQKEVVNNNQEELIFKVEDRDIFKIDENLMIAAMNPATKNDQVDVRLLSDLIDINSIDLLNLLKLRLGISRKQSYTVGKFIEMRNQAKTKVMADILQTDGGMDAQQATKVAPAVTKLLVSPDESEPEIKDNISSVRDLFNDKVIRDLTQKLYRDDSLINYIAAIREVDFAKVKVGTDIDAMNRFKSDCAVSLNANIDSLKPMIRDIYKDEMQIVFDSLFMRDKFNESAFQAAYSKLIISAFDKLIDKKQGRVTEGILRNLKRIASATASNLLKMAPIVAPIIGAASWLATTVYGPVLLPVILGSFGAWNVFSSWKSVAKWEKAKRNYQENPLQYIEDTIFKDASARRAIQTLVNGAAADVVVSRINPTYNARQQAAKTGLMGGLSEYSSTLDAQVKEFKSLSKEDQAKAKSLNDHVLKQLAKTKYYNHVITESMINLIFNEMLFGKDRVSDDTRRMLLDRSLTPENAQEVSKLLIAAIKNSAVKNNFVGFVEKEVRKASKMFSGENKRFDIADDEELKRRRVKGGKGLAALGDNEVFGMHAQLFISPEQIQEEFIDKLLQKIIGKSKADYKKSDDLKDREEFKENIIGGSLTRLLFEADDISDDDVIAPGGKEQEDLEGERAEANKQKNTPLLAAALGAGTWVHSLYYTHYISKLGGGGLPIFKDIVAKIPGTPDTIVDKFIPNPGEAEMWNELGMDMGHKLIEFIDPITQKKQLMYFYYYSSSKFAGTAKALSAQIIDPLTGKAKMIQHNMSEWFAENAGWAKKAGLALDSKGETAMAIKGVAGAKELAANSTEMKFVSNAILTNLEGSYKAEIMQVKEIVQNFNVKAELQTLADAGNVDMGDVAQTLYKGWAAQMQLPGADANFTPTDELAGFFKHACILLDKASKAGDTAAQKGLSWNKVQSSMEGFMKDISFAQDKFEVAKEVGSMDGLTSGEIADMSNEYAEAIEAAFNKWLGQINMKWTEVVNKEVILKAYGTIAQQGHNPMLDFEIVPGQDGMITKTRVVQDLTEPDVPVLELKSAWAQALDSAAGALGKAGIISKIIGKFWKRGINGGEFAKQFTNMFDLEDQTYSDMMRAFMGGEIKGAPAGMGANGHADSSSSWQPGSSIVMKDANNTGFAVTKLPDEITKEDTKSAQKKESFVYKNNIANFLFENKLVKKSVKDSSLQKELNEHKNLQKMFKNLI